MSLLNSIGVPTVAMSFLMSGGLPSEAPQPPQMETSVTSSSVPGEKVNNASHSSTAVKSSTTESLYGIDISSHQHGSESVDISKAVDGGVQYAFIKATEGTHYMNPHFRDDVLSFIEKDIPIGFYHYAIPTDSQEEAREQARLFVAVTGINGGVKTIAPVLDIEENKNNLSASQLIAWTQAFVDEVKKLTEMDVMIYTYPNFWKDEMGNTTEFSHLPLWLASYNGKSHPGKIPGGWNTWTFWQYTSDGRVDGYSKEIDLNVYNGTGEDLKEMYNSK